MSGTIIQISRPIANVNTLWNSNSYASIDDVVLQPNAGDGVKCNANSTDDNEAQAWYMSRIKGDFSFIDGVMVWVNAYKVGTAGNPTVNINIGGVNQTAQSMALTTSAAWYSFGFTGTWNLGDWNYPPSGSQVIITSGSISGDVYVDVVYAEVYCYPYPRIV